MYNTLKKIFGTGKFCLEFSPKFVKLKFVKYFENFLPCIFQRFTLDALRRCDLLDNESSYTTALKTKF